MKFKVRSSQKYGFLYLATEDKFPKGKIAALKASIQKHEFLLKEILARGEMISDGGISTCALCHLYNTLIGCAGCPVAEKSKHDFCENTPYVSIYRARTWQTQARAERWEIKFLKSLLSRRKKGMHAQSS